jgi:hypothetical protein
MRRQKLSQEILALFLAAFFIFAGYKLVLAIYDPGETLDPDCAPGDEDCTVTPLVSSQWSSGEDGVVYYDNGYVGIGTDEPTSFLEVTNSSADDTNLVHFQMGTNETPINSLLYPQVL